MASHLATPLQTLRVVPGEKLTEFQALRNWFIMFTAEGSHVTPQLRDTLRQYGMLEPPLSIFKEYDQLVARHQCLALVQKPLHDIDSNPADRHISWKRTANVEMLLQTALIVLDSLPPLPEVMKSGLRQNLALALSTITANYDELRGDDKHSSDRKHKILNLRNNINRLVSLSSISFVVLSYLYDPNKSTIFQSPVPTLPSLQDDESVVSDDGDSPDIVHSTLLEEGRTPSAPSTRKLRSQSGASTANANPETVAKLTQKNLCVVFNQSLLDMSPIRSNAPTEVPMPTAVPIEDPDDADACQLLINFMTNSDAETSKSKPRKPYQHFETCLWRFMYKYPRVIREDDEVPYIMHYKNTRNLALCFIRGSCDAPGPGNVPIRLAIMLDMNAIGFKPANGAERSDRSRYVIFLFYFDAFWSPAN